MSLEEVIKANTEAVSALTKALEAVTKIGSLTLVETPKEEKTPKPTTVKKTPASATSAAPTPTPTPEPATEASTPAATVTAQTAPAGADAYKPVQQATFAFHKKHGRDKLFEVFAQFGIESAQMLKPEQYAEYMEALQAADGEAVA